MEIGSVLRHYTAEAVSLCLRFSKSVNSFQMVFIMMIFRSLSSYTLTLSVGHLTAGWHVVSRYHLLSSTTSLTAEN